MGSAINAGHNRELTITSSTDAERIARNVEQEVAFIFGTGHRRTCNTEVRRELFEFIFAVRARRGEADTLNVIFIDIYGVVELGRIDLATFANPAGLQKTGNTYFQQSLNSGDPVVVEAGTEGTGSIMASTLEASNVDLSNEFSDMIMTQRGFQASSRVITVSDTMLEELINLKR